MNKIYELEALRGIASIYVLLHHTVFHFNIIEKKSLLGFFFSFGDVAVMAFFLLSGFVISMSLNKNTYDFKEYFLHRFIRIYSIVFIAWILSFLSYYLVNGMPKFEFLNIIGNILMLQDLSGQKIGIVTTPIFNNSPLWSLSYEWWFYMFFFWHFYLYTKNYKDKLVLFQISGMLISFFGLIFYTLNHNAIAIFMSYYFIWFSGALIFLHYMRSSLYTKAILKVLLSYIFIIVTLIILYFTFPETKFFGYVMRSYLASILNLLFVLIFIVYIFKYIKNYFIYKKIIYIISLTAKISFALYVIHYPIRDFFLSFKELNMTILFILTIITSIFISYYLEIKIFGYLKKKLI